MYNEFYGLKEKPFTILPDPDYLYWGKNHSMAFSMLEYGILNQAGFKSKGIPYTEKLTEIEIKKYSLQKEIIPVATKI